MRPFAVVLAVLASVSIGDSSAASASNWETMRRRMVEEIEADTYATRRETGRDRFDPRVMSALAKVPRHEFVPSHLQPRAYQNRPLPIGYGQTISQPYIVALMTDLLDVEAGDRVLEIGTGSGYQAAVLAEMGIDVFSVEIIPELGNEAASRLERLGYRVRARVGDGYFGWAEHSPFDAIIVTAAAGHVPPPLIDQLSTHGRMVIPVGGPFSVQQLTLVEKNAAGEVFTRQVLPVAFVPLTGGREDHRP